MVDSKLISLCNVIYKILSKTLVNRIKLFLNSVIGEVQSAFVSNRLITDNIILALEVFHWLSLGRKSKGKDVFVLKIDMNKAYDIVE